MFVFVALSKLVNSLKETDSLSTEQELEFLQSLLESKELNALVNVHSKVAKVCKDDRLAPLISTSMQVSFSFRVNLLFSQFVKFSLEHFLFFYFIYRLH